MAEKIGTTNPLASGGHRWVWADQDQRAKEFGAPGIAGAGSMVIQNGPRPGQIEGVLRASGSTRAVADTALDVLEEPIEALRRSGAASAWEDDEGHPGDHLVIRAYRRLGPRLYGRATVGGDPGWAAWQPYRIEVRELDGKP